MIFESYRQELQAHCYRILGSPHDAEDAVQETLVRAWRARSGFRGAASTRTWLHTIAVNTSLSAIRSGRRRPVPVEQLPGDRATFLVLDTAVMDPAVAVADRAHLAVAVTRAVEVLVPRQWAVLVLRDVLGFSASETAELLHTSRVAVNSALQRARAALAGPATAVRAPAPRRLVEAYVDAIVTGDAARFVEVVRRQGRSGAEPLDPGVRRQGAA